MVGWEYNGPYDDFKAQQELGGYPIVDSGLEKKRISAISPVSYTHLTLPTKA